jgi:cell division protein FtsW
MILFLTGFASRRGPFLRTFRAGFLPSLCYVAITAGLVVAEPDLGQTLFLVALSAAVLMVNGLQVKHFLPVLLLAGPGLLLFMSGQWDYVRERWTGFLAGGAYQVRQALLFLGAGGLEGQGLGEGRGHLFVPEIHNDFALVAVGEHLGLAGSAAVVLAFVLLFYNGLRIAFLAKDRIGFSIAFGISFMIALQASVNIAVATGSVPPKGISIPFLSYGGSSLLVLGVAMGFLWSVAAETRRALSGSDAPESAPDRGPVNSNNALARAADAAAPAPSQRKLPGPAVPLEPTPGLSRKSTRFEYPTSLPPDPEDLPHLSPHSRDARRRAS